MAYSLIPAFLGVLLAVTLTSAGTRRAPRHEPVRFLALGDSYTIGEGVEPAQRWPVVLAARLRARHVNVADPEIIARTGWTTDELSAAITAASPAGAYGLVTLLIGVNNQYRGRDTTEYRAQFRDLLARAVALAGGAPARVLVVSIPDWGVTEFAEGRDRAAIGAAVDAFNTVALAEAVRAGCHWADITPLSRRHGMAPGRLAADGLHPSASAYAEWAKVADDTLRAGFPSAPR